MSWFDCHRQFLPIDHPFRKNREAFVKGRVERSHPPIRFSGDHICEQVRFLPKITQIPPSYGKLTGYGETHNWTKQSIFWELPYWKDNLVRHNLDVMHIEKNVFDNIFNTVMDIKGKTKDNEGARLDLVEICKRPALHLRPLPNGKFNKPKASFTLTREQRQDLCMWVEGLKMPDGYASNLSRCVDKTRMKLHGLKSHDCHVFMQRLLPIAFYTLPQNVWKPLTELSQFFRDLCCTELREENLNQMEKNIPIILCKLERIFPPGFFDSMEHLPLHLPYEALMCGPVQYRWMYPFERFLHDLKAMVSNKARPEGSICEAYLIQEVGYFASYYFEPDIHTRRSRSKRNEFNEGSANQIPHSRSIFNLPGRPAGKCTTRYLTDSEFNAAKLHVLINCDEVQDFIRYFKEYLKITWPHLSESDIEQSFDANFADWFRKYVHDPKNMVQNELLYDIAFGPSRKVKTWPKFFVNGYIFHVDSLAERRKTCNSGLCVKGEGTSEFYGKLREIVELEYPGSLEKRVVLFNCDWFDSVSSQGIRIHKEYGLIEIKQNAKYPKYDPFIIAQHASQVYFLPYPGKTPSKAHWRFVMKTRPRSRVDHSNTSEKDQHAMGEALQEPYACVNEIVDIDPIENLVDSSQPPEHVSVPQFQVPLEEEDDDFDDDDGVSEADMESEFSDDKTTSDEDKNEYESDDDSDDEGHDDAEDNE